MPFIRALISEPTLWDSLGEGRVLVRSEDQVWRAPLAGRTGVRAGLFLWPRKAGCTRRDVDPEVNAAGREARATTYAASFLKQSPEPSTGEKLRVDLPRE